MFKALYNLKTRSTAFNGFSTSYLNGFITTKHCLISSKEGPTITAISCEGWPNNCNFVIRSCNLVSRSAIVYEKHYYN